MNSAAIVRGRPHKAGDSRASIKGPFKGTFPIFKNYHYYSMQIGGQGGIRTHGELPPTAVFKTAALNHSATCPIQYLTVHLWPATAVGRRMACSLCFAG